MEPPLCTVPYQAAAPITQNADAKPYDPYEVDFKAQGKENVGSFETPAHQPVNQNPYGYTQMVGDDQVEGKGKWDFSGPVFKGQLGMPAPSDDQLTARAEAQGWNDLLYQAMGNPDDSKMKDLRKNFLSTCNHLAKIIVDQILFKGRVLIPPADAGGVAGGEKFIENGIMFKLVQDPKVGDLFLYGGQEPNLNLAAKAAGHELRAVDEHIRLSLPDVRLPWQVIIEYRGFRIIAMPLLKLSQIVIGSDDGGATVHTSCPEANNILREFAKNFHLAPHFVGGSLLYCAGDCEGHLGKDGFLYLLDMARSFPPEHPLQTPHLVKSGQSVFYRQHRPEYLRLLKSRGYPTLSSDACTMWGKLDKNVFNARCSTSTKYLVADWIPECANILQEVPVASGAELTHWMHKNGINVRHLALLLQLTTSQTKKLLIWKEMSSRVLKQLLRKAFQDLHSTVGVQHQNFDDVCLTFLNNVSGSGPATEDFWESQFEATMLEKFGQLAVQHGLKRRCRELDRVTEPCGVYLQSEVLKDYSAQLSKNAKPYMFHDGCFTIAHTSSTISPAQSGLLFFKLQKLLGSLNLLLQDSHLDVELYPAFCTIIQETISQCEQAANDKFSDGFSVLRLRLLQYLDCYTSALARRPKDLQCLFESSFLNQSLMLCCRDPIMKGLTLIAQDPALEALSPMLLSLIHPTEAIDFNDEWKGVLQLHSARCVEVANVNALFEPKKPLGLNQTGLQGLLHPELAGVELGFFEAVLTPRELNDQLVDIEKKLRQHEGNARLNLTSFFFIVVLAAVSALPVNPTGMCWSMGMIALNGGLGFWVEWSLRARLNHFRISPFEGISVRSAEKPFPLWCIVAGCLLEAASLLMVLLYNVQHSLVIALGDMQPFSGQITSCMLPVAFVLLRAVCYLVSLICPTIYPISRCEAQEWPWPVKHVPLFLYPMNSFLVAHKDIGFKFELTVLSSTVFVCVTASLGFLLTRQSDDVNFVWAVVLLGLAASLWGGVAAILLKKSGCSRPEGQFIIDNSIIPRIYISVVLVGFTSMLPIFVVVGMFEAMKG